jgi:hypothetical protein
MLGWIYLLLRGEDWVWWITVALLVLDLAWVLFSGSFLWWRIVTSLGEIGLLLLPATRRYFPNDEASVGPGARGRAQEAAKAD